MRTLTYLLSLGLSFTLVGVSLAGDCDGDGKSDGSEVLLGAEDCNRNGIPDECDVASLHFRVARPFYDAGPMGSGLVAGDLGHPTADLPSAQLHLRLAPPVGPAPSRCCSHSAGGLFLYLRPSTTTAWSASTTLRQGTSPSRVSLRQSSSPLTISAGASSRQWMTLRGPRSASLKRSWTLLQSL